YVQLNFADNNSATGAVSAHLELGIGNTTYYAAVRYLDEYRRENARWYIVHRQMRVIHVGPWSDVEQSLSRTLNIRWPGSTPTVSDFPRQSSQD
ncbi:MAG TPA: nuclear transport factor 2 family protein, partial [Sphingorhabdus lacus]|nr:nuclear transport factor 2 family protein [Sphingorhabdus lacus]